MILSPSANIIVNRYDFRKFQGTLEKSPADWLLAGSLQNQESI